MTLRARLACAAAAVVAALWLASSAQGAPAWAIVPGSLYPVDGPRLYFGASPSLLRAEGARAPGPELPMFLVHRGWRLDARIDRGRIVSYFAWGAQWRQSGLRVGDRLVKIKRVHAGKLAPVRVDPNNQWAGLAVDRVTWYLRSGRKAVGFVTIHGRLTGFMVGSVATVRRELALFGPIP